MILNQSNQFGAIDYSNAIVRPGPIVQSGLKTVPPSKTNGRVVAPPVSKLSYILSLYRIGAQSPLQASKQLDNISNFDWRNKNDVQKYCIDGSFWSTKSTKKTWTNNGNYIGPPLDQGQCGNCYAFSSTKMLTDRFCIVNDLDNSDGQQMFSVGEATKMSSDPSVFNTSGVGACPIQNNNCCNGGFPSCVGVYVQQNGIHRDPFCQFDTNTFTSSSCECGSSHSSVSSLGSSSLVTEAAKQQLPVTNQTNACVNDPSQKCYPIAKNSVVKLPNGSTTTENSVINYVQYYDNNLELKTPTGYGPNLNAERQGIQNYIKYHLLSHGPCTVCLYAGGLDNYDGSIIKDTSGQVDPNQYPSTMVDHAVLCIGWATDTTQKDDLGRPLQYWLIQNSWGTSWGDGGYFKFAFSTDKINSWYGLDYPVRLKSDGQLYGGGTGFLLAGMQAVDPEEPTSGPVKQISDQTNGQINTGTEQINPGTEQMAVLPANVQKNKKLLDLIYTEVKSIRKQVQVHNQMLSSIMDPNSMSEATAAAYASSNMSPPIINPQIPRKPSNT